MKTPGPDHHQHRFLSRSEAATLCGLSYSKLAHLVNNPDGPPIIRIGRRVLYCPADLVAWVQSHRATPISRPRGRPRKNRTSISAASEKRSGK